MSQGIILSVYGLIQMILPEFNHPFWAYLMGFFSGISGGAQYKVDPPLSSIDVWKIFFVTAPATILGVNLVNVVTLLNLNK